MAKIANMTAEIFIKIMMVLSIMHSVNTDAMPSDLLQRFPYWSPYLWRTTATKLDYLLKGPIDVWPDRIMQNFSQLEVRVTWYNPYFILS